MEREVIDQVLELLEKEYPNAKCELNYSTPFELLIATILSAQCTDVRVNQVTSVLFGKYNTPESILKLGEEGLIEIIRSCGFYKNKSKNILASCQILVENYSSDVPDTMEELVKLPGVGRKTANVVLSNAFDVPAIAVDTHVFRVSNRIGIANGKTPDQVEKQLMKVIKRPDWTKFHHVFIFHGRYLCKARKPECARCPVAKLCKYINEE